jgi:hypothetical protein
MTPQQREQLGPTLENHEKFTTMTAIRTARAYEAFERRTATRARQQELLDQEQLASPNERLGFRLREIEGQLEYFMPTSMTVPDPNNPSSSKRYLTYTTDGQPYPPPPPPPDDDDAQEA